MNCTKRVALIGVALVLGAALTACGKPTPPAPKTYTITIDQMAYSPKTLSARVGDTIVWDNKDIFRHTATARDNTFDLDIDAGKKASVVLSKPGTVQVICRYHPDMTGQLMVNP
jgi:plastocyanin